MGDLAQNLSRHEFACSCNCGLDTVDIETVSVIQDVCDYFQCRVTITSGCRCELYNLEVGGAPKSQHPKCRAADCQFQGVEPEDVYKYLMKVYEGKYGFGLYKTFVHIDTRSNGPARWNKATH